MFAVLLTVACAGPPLESPATPLEESELGLGEQRDPAPASGSGASEPAVEPAVQSGASEPAVQLLAPESGRGVPGSADPVGVVPEPEPNPGSLGSPVPLGGVATPPPGGTVGRARAAGSGSGRARSRRLTRCLPGVMPCYRTTSARLLLAGLGGFTGVGAVASIFILGDRQKAGDPAVALGGAGLVAVSAVVLGGAVALLSGDGPALYDRITPATVGLSLGLGGSGTTDESGPYTLSGSFAPTLRFPHELGRIRLIGRVGGDLGQQIERDPRPQGQVDDNGQGGTFPVGLESRSWALDLGIDLALRLPYPGRRRSRREDSRRARLGEIELRYKPQVYLAREQLTLAGDAERVSQRVALTPLTFGLRWHISPRQRFTFYLGPRWDLIGYGEPGLVEAGRPELAPIYGEAWFDMDLPIWKLSRARRASVVGQFNLGYVHSRLEAPGIDIGSIVGFIGYVVNQFTIRVRPVGARVAYQFSIGARAGRGLHPFLEAGIVLPELGAKSGGQR